MFLAFRHYHWSIFWLFLIGPSAQAQTKTQVADSLKKVIAEHRSSMHVADSIGDSHVAVDFRLRLARMVKPKEALSLLQEAASISDIVGLLEDEVEARRLLAEQYARTGNHRAAYAEAMRIVTLDNERLAVQEEVAGSNAEIGIANAKAERDSLERRWQQELQGSRHRESHMEATAERWMFIASGIVAVLVVLLITVLVRMGRYNKRTRSEMDALRAEITTLKEQRPMDQVRGAPTPVVPLPGPIVVPVVPPTPQPSPAAEIDPMVLAMFRKMGPERLATLRDARTRGDHAKVTRVVHSLKPQLVNFDRDLFTDLCARITAPDALADEVRWSADLDALETGISDVLQRIGH